MDRKMLVSMLHKSIKELEMITEGFMELKEFPSSILLLAHNKTEDIQDFISRLERLKELELSKPNPVEMLVLEKKKGRKVQEKETKKEKKFLLAEEQKQEKETSPVEKIEEENKEVVEDLSQESEEEHLEALEASEEEKEIAEKSLDEACSQEEKIEGEDIEEEDKTVSLKNTKKKKGAPLVDKQQQQQQTIPNTIGDAHTNGKIDDIKQAMSIGDRFRFQRDLFNGNGEELNKTLSHLNQLKDFDSALKFIHSKFKWDEEDETVENFFMILRRRYL